MKFTIFNYTSGMQGGQLTTAPFVTQPRDSGAVIALDQGDSRFVVAVPVVDALALCLAVFGVLLPCLD